MLFIARLSNIIINLCYASLAHTHHAPVFLATVSPYSGSQKFGRFLVILDTPLASL